jgi:vancomycin resistance protein YoaR
MSILHLCGPVAAGAVLAVVAMAARMPAQHTTEGYAVAMSQALRQESATAVPVDARTARRRLAKRMRNAIAQRAAFLSRSVQATFVDASGNSVATKQIELAEHPEWVSYDLSRSEPTAFLNSRAVAQSLAGTGIVALPRPVHCDLQYMQSDAYDVLRVETSCIAKSGYEFDPAVLTADIVDAVAQKQDVVSLPVTAVAGTVRDVDGFGLGDLQLLSVGKSNFKGSGVGRKANVRKAIGERVHNVVVPVDAEFSFNDVLGGPVTQSAGWQMALTIFEGVNLREAPGGGICQASTTVYRAALNAGLPIVEQKSHSLYVTYYEAYGVGQDATVFPGKQNLRFRNDTGAPLLLQSYYEGDDAYVHILGRPDGRQVTVDGPYFGSTAPADVQVNGRAVRGNEIVWVRTITSAEGAQTKEVLVSRYNAVPKTLVAKWPATSQTTLHADAALVANQR